MSNRFPSTIPEALPRVVAAQVVLLSAAAVLFRQAWILPLLAADFALRSLINPCWSPLASVGRAFVRRFAPAGRKVPFAPKRFAAGIGLGFAGAASVLAFAGLPAAAAGVVAVLAACAALEAAAGFCVGCVVYNGLVRAGWVRSPECVECGQWSPGLRPVRHDR